jgi:hypothetical protein
MKGKKKEYLYTKTENRFGGNKLNNYDRIFSGSYIEAMNIKNLFENNAISVFTANEYMFSIQPWSVSAGGSASAILKVHEKELDNAKKIIDDYNKGEYNLEG